MSDDVYFATRPFNGSWSTNENVNEVSSLPPQSGGAPAIAVDDAGNAYALWADASDGNIYFSYRPVGGAWDANVKVNTTGTAGSPSIDVDPQGNAYAIWDYGDDIYFALRPAGGAWGSQSKVNDSGSGGMAGAPAIAVDDTGNAYAIWYDYRNGNFDIYFAYRATGETWSANTKVNDDIDTAGQGVPAIAVDGAGNAYAVWQDYRNNSNSDIYLAYRPANGVWETNVKVDDDTGTASQSNPAVAVNSAGQAHIAWRDNRNSVATLYFATYPFEAR